MTARLNDCFANSAAAFIRGRPAEAADAPQGSDFQQIVADLGGSMTPSSTQESAQPGAEVGTKRWAIAINPHFMGQFDAPQPFADASAAAPRELDEASGDEDFSTDADGDASVATGDIPLQPATPPDSPPPCPSPVVCLAGGAENNAPHNADRPCELEKTAADEKRLMDKSQSTFNRAAPLAIRDEVNDRILTGGQGEAEYWDRDNPLRRTISVGSPDRHDGKAKTDATPASASLAMESGSAVKIHVADLSTHFPIAIASLLPAPSSNPAAVPPVAHHEAQSAPVERPAAGPRRDLVKILRFELEPAALGALSVKMRVSHTRVEIEIDTQSATTTNLLSQARDVLTSAIEHKGLALHAFEVTT
jgi:hypothetical protein